MTHHPTPVNQDLELASAIAELEGAIAQLKHRYDEILLAEREQVVLERQQNQLKHQRPKSPAIEQELAQIRSRLEELDAILESHLVNLWEPFWQAVRFGGLGIVIGWFLCSLK